MHLGAVTGLLIERENPHMYGRMKKETTFALPFVVLTTLECVTPSTITDSKNTETFNLSAKNAIKASDHNFVRLQLAFKS